MTPENVPTGFRLWSIIYPAAPILVMLLVAWRRPHLFRAFFRRIENRWIAIARHKWMSGILVFLASLLLSLALSFLVRWPRPVIGDEFSYLLAAETFAQGRLANPPHPLWQHFESLHIIQQPTYASKYPPAQGLVMAAGQAMAGAPIVGVWLSLALGCAAIYWMLLAWLKPRHALLGGLLATVHPIVLEWGQNYWGGAVAMLGGALTLGAFGRLWKSPRRRDGFILGLGLAIMANSRPFEGALLAALLAVFTLIHGGIEDWRALITRIAIPAALVLAPAAALMGYYNFRVTGSALRMPYAVHEETYAVAPPFLWQPARPEPGYRHESIRRFYTGYALDSYLAQRSPIGFLHKGVARKIGVLLRGYLATTVMALALLVFPWVWRRERRQRVLWLILGLFLAGVFAETWMMPHYAAPAVGLLFLLTVDGWRLLRAWKVRGRRTGLWLARAAVLFGLLGAVHLAFRLDRDEKTSWAWIAERSRIERELDSPHLVIVRYGPHHNAHEEWIYNAAEIDRAKVVWAREMDEAGNRRLRQYYADRKCLLLEVDQGLTRMHACR